MLNDRDYFFCRRMLIIFAAVATLGSLLSSSSVPARIVQEPASLSDDPQDPDPPALDAQDAEMDVDVVVVEAENVQMIFGFDFEPGKMKAAKRFHLTHVFQVEIESIERICELNDQQNTKMRIAAKGAVKKLTDAWWKKNGSQFGDGIRPPIEPSDQNQNESTDQVTDEEEIEIKDANEIDDSMAQFILMDLSDNPFRTLAPTDEMIWKNLVAGILTAEQLQKLAEHKAAQRQQKQDEIFQMLLGQFNRELHLTAEQKELLGQALKPNFADFEFNCIPLYEPFIGYCYAARVKDEELAKFLSPAQIQLFRMTVRPALEIEMMMNLDGNEVAGADEAGGEDD
jgi:hypothetical protein